MEVPSNSLRELDLRLVPGPVNYLCPCLDPRPGLLLCMGDWVMDLTLLLGAEGPSRGSRQPGESQAEAASDFCQGPPCLGTIALGQGDSRF